MVSRAVSAVSERAWNLFGHQADNGTWVAVGSEFFVKNHGYETSPVPVTVTENPDGDYLGWLDAASTTPALIQHHRIFNIQFPYGYKAEEDRGAGVAVRLSIAGAAGSVTPERGEHDAAR